MLNTISQKKAYFKYLLAKYPFIELHNMLGTLKSVHALAKQEQAAIYTNLDYKPIYGGAYNIKDTQYLDKLDIVNDKISNCSVLIDIVSRAVIQKILQV